MCRRVIGSSGTLGGQRVLYAPESAILNEKPFRVIVEPFPLMPVIYKGPASLFVLVQELVVNHVMGDVSGGAGGKNLIFSVAFFIPGADHPFRDISHHVAGGKALFAEALFETAPARGVNTLGHPVITTVFPPFISPWPGSAFIT